MSTTSNLDAKKRLHSFQIRFFFKPILCAHCSDYIWGEGYLGFGCVQCGSCVHTRCKLFQTAGAASECGGGGNHQLDVRTKSAYFAVDSWSVANVKEWLAVVNLHRYAEVFSTYNITGSKLLALDIYQLYAFRIRDSYHHAAILQARDELIHRSRHYCNQEKMLAEIEQSKSHLVAHQYKPDSHHFLVHSISRLTDCDMCHRPLLGIVHQCLGCQRCGLMVHRQCSSIGLPKCQTRPHDSHFKRHYIFGVSLFDLASQNAGGEITPPLILTKCFREIEERALATNEDLYDVYRLSADTSKIDEIKQTINETGCELIQLSGYDLNTLAALVKTFLRDLQNSVIPEEMYELLVARIQTISSDELRSLMSEHLPPVNYVCLKHVMAHLIRVWCYQFKVRGCHYLPDKLFHIFRSILMRPPWEKITQIVYNVENQTLVIQRLMLECNWGDGVELPEYKIRPKRPMNPSMSLETMNPSGMDHDTSKRLNNLVKHVSASNTCQNLRSMTMSSSSSSSSVSSSTQETLNDSPWYWSDLSRDDTILVLKNCPDGSFLVRNSSDRAQSAPYTLCVMKSTFVKSIKIFKQEQQNGVYFFDIEKPCRFESVQGLIAYYSRVSLKEYNHNLDVVLTYGVSKYKFGKTTEWSLDKLYSSFRDAYHQFQQMTKKYDGLESEIGYIREDICQKKTACEALDKIMAIYQSQIEQVEKVLNEILLKKNQTISSTRLLAASLMPVIGLAPATQTSGNDSNDDVEQTQRLMNANRDKLKLRVEDLMNNKEEIRRNLDYLSKILGQLQEELDMLRPELIELRKKRENYHMWLLQRGENDDKIQTRLKEDMKNIGKTPADIETLLSSTTSTLMPTASQLKSSSSMQNLESLGTTIEETTQHLVDSSINDKSTSSPKFSNNETTDQDPHSNSLNWYIPDCDRERAYDLLSNRSNGSYLVRPNLKQQNSKYILSLVHEEQVKHILIEEDATGCFLKSSFNPPDRYQTRLNSLGKLSVKSAPGTNDELPDKHISPSQKMNRSASTTYSTIGSLIAASNSLSTFISRGSRTGDYLHDVSEENEKPAESRGPKFKTLTDLVCHYTKNPVTVDTMNLNLCLLYPVMIPPVDEITKF